MHRGKVDPGVSELPRGNELSRDHVNRPLVEGFFNLIIFNLNASKNNNTEGLSRGWGRGYIIILTWL